MVNMTKVWVVIERPTPAEEPIIVGSSNDEDYIDSVITALRSVSRDQSYWKECIEYMHI